MKNFWRQFFRALGAIMFLLAMIGGWQQGDLWIGFLSGACFWVLCDMVVTGI